MNKEHFVTVLQSDGSEELFVKVSEIEKVISQLEKSKDRHPPLADDDEYKQGLKSGLTIGFNKSIEPLKELTICAQ